MRVSGFPTLPRFLPNPKHFILSCKKNIVKYAKKKGENVVKNAISI